MNQELIDIAVERGRLIERISNQRQILARDLQPVAGTLHTADRAITSVRQGTAYLKQHPEIVAVGVALLIVVKPGRVWRWSKRGYFAWRALSALRRQLTDLGVLARQRP
ncbi:YqjK-like family protein [Candidatus Accumulibacter sp. ACC007]|uniref:YqjK-like family protein n=1 Tax=Candidatus Accumulibacter sp. ACC007 TaxID=2823333 RepID=UPI0025C3703E|nr:YqjK-like family protein [Candidatus Accumulibacter sp. ACC007]